MPTAEELLSKLQEIDDLHRDDKKSFIDPLNSERDKKIFYEKSQYVNQFMLPKDMEDREELLELCQINYQQLENAAPDHLTIFRPQLKDAWQNLAKRIIKKIKRYGELNDDTINYAKGCGFDPNSDNLDTVDIKEIKGAGVPKSMGDIKAGVNILKDAAADAKKAMAENKEKMDLSAVSEELNNPKPAKPKRKKLRWILAIIAIIALSFLFQERDIKCSNCKRVMQPNRTAYTTSAITSTAGEIKKAGYGDVLCSTSCLGKFAQKYPSIRNKW